MKLQESVWSSLCVQKSTQTLTISHSSVGSGRLSMASSAALPMSISLDTLHQLEITVNLTSVGNYRPVC